MYNFRINSLLILFIIFSFLSCKDNNENVKVDPSVTTKPVSAVNETGVTFNAEIANLGSSGLTDHGFVYDSVPNPTFDQSVVISLGPVTQKGVYNTVVNKNLILLKKYYVKAYVIRKDNGEIIYGDEVNFISLGNSPPQLSDFFPTSGTIGDTIKINGWGFNTDITNCRILFGKDTAMIVRSYFDSIICIVPTHLPVGSSTIYYVSGKNNIASDSSFMLNPLTITSVTTDPLAVGDTVTISGNNIPKEKNLVSVYLFVKKAEIVSCSKTEIKAIINDSVTMNLYHIMIIAGTQTIFSTENIRLKPPVINSFTPVKGAKHTRVTLTGNNFSPVAQNVEIQINDIDAEVINSSLKEVQFWMPDGLTSGNYPIKVTFAHQSATSEKDFTFLIPVISSISPLHGTWGTTVTITGQNFLTVPEDNIVKFSGINAEVISATETQLKVTVPNDLLQVSSVISVDSKPEAEQPLTFTTEFQLDPPTLLSFNPGEGKKGDLVTLNGQNFNPVPENQVVKFGKYTAEVAEAGHDQLIVKLPSNLIDTTVYITIDLMGYTFQSGTTFHLVSPWKHIADYPGGPIISAVAFATGNFGYVTLGTPTTLNFLKSCWKYDPAINIWMEVNPFRFFGFGVASGYQNCIAVTIQDYTYVGLGTTGSGMILSEFSKYSDTSNTWTESPEMPIPVDKGVGININNLLYVTTGITSGSQLNSKLYVYDPVGYSWQIKADFPGNGRTEAIGFAINGKGYVATGNNRNTYYNDLWQYNPATDSWKQMSNLPGVARTQANSFNLGSFGYIIGGFDNQSNLLSEFWKYDPSTDSWERLDDFPGIARDNAVIFVVQNKAYYGTGFGGKYGKQPNGYLNDFWEYDPGKE